MKPFKGSSEGAAHVKDRLNFTPPFPDQIDQIAVTTTSGAYTVPEGIKYIIFAYEPGANIAVRAENTAVYPAAGITDGTGSLINPANFDVSGVSALHFIAKDTDTVVSLALYA